MPGGLNWVDMFPSSITAGHRELSKASEKSSFTVLIPGLELPALFKYHQEWHRNFKTNEHGEKMG